MERGIPPAHAISVRIMANLLEEVALLAYRDDNGRNNTPYLPWSIAGAALLELRLDGRISVDDSRRVDLVDAEPTGDHALDGVVERLRRSKVRHVVSSWVTTLAGVDLKQHVLEELVEQGVLSLDKDKLLGFIPVNRFLPAQGRVEDEIRARLDEAFTHPHGADVRTAALAGVVAATMMERAALPQHKSGAVTQTFRELADGFPETGKLVEGVGQSVTIHRGSGGTGLVATDS